MYNPRETQLDLLITRSVLAIFVIVCMVFMGAFAQKEGLLYTLIKLSSVETKGEITRIIENQYNRNIETADYVFRVNNKEYTANFKLIERYDNRSYKQGDIVEIVYSSFFPKYNSVKNRLKYNEFSFYLLSFTAFISLLSIIFILWNTLRYYKFKEESTYY